MSIAAGIAAALGPHVVYRNGAILAAYLHLVHTTAERTARTVASPNRLLIVDYAATGRPMGVEITLHTEYPSNY